MFPNEALAQAQFSVALDYIAGGDRASGERALREAIRLRTDHTGALYELGRLLLESRPAEAVEVFQRLVECVPEFAEGHAGLGLAWRASGDVTRARAALQRAVSLKPDEPSLRAVFADVLSALGQFDDALAESLEANRLDPNSVRASNAGLLLEAVGRPDEALGWYRRAAKLDEQDPEPLVLLASCLSDMGRNDEAVTALRDALARSPTEEPRIMSRLAQGLIRVGRHAEGWDLLDRVVRTAPNDPFVQESRILALSEAGRHEEAVQVAEEAVAGASAAPGVLFARALALLEAGRPELSLEAFEKAMQVEPTYVECSPNLRRLLNECREAVISKGGAAGRG